MDSMKHFRAQAIIFDKDGTLIDFHTMWGGWATYLADQIQHVSGCDVLTALYEAMGYADINKKVLAGGKLASSTMGKLHQLTIDIVQASGFSAEHAKQIVGQAWAIPDPVLLAKQFTDTRTLFHSLRKQNIHIAIATADDRAPTQAMIEAFDIESYISTMICADDGIPSKPEPDMVLTICKRLSIEPVKAMVIGDTASDLKMARAAGAGLCVGVLSGVSSTKDLIHHADVLIESVDELHVYVEALAEHESHLTQNGFNTDFAF
jgi:phosphoglycolate phosphatase